MIPLGGSGVDPLDVYARRIHAGWIAEVPGLRHLRLTLNTMDLHNSKDDTLPPVDFEVPADASFFWMNVPGSPAQEWTKSN